jgi:hypothetical protein
VQDIIQLQSDLNSAEQGLFTHTTIEQAMGKVIEKMKDAKEGRSVFAELKADETSRMRYARNLSDKTFIDAWGPRWGRSFQLLTQLVEKSQRRMLKDWITKLSSYVNKDTTDKVLIDSFKVLTTEAKKSGYTWEGVDWQLYVDWSTFGWYLDPADITEEERSAITEDARYWLGEEKVHKSVWFDHVTGQQQGIAEFFDRCVPRERVDWISLDEYCSNPYWWARNGSSDGPRLTVVAEDGKEVRALKTKWNTALAITAEEMKKMMITSQKCQDRVFIKTQETTKWRSLVNSNWELFAQMNWILELLKAIVVSHPNTPLLTDSVKVDLNMVDFGEALKRGGWGVSLDQSSFDHEVESGVRTAAIEYLLNFVGRWCPLEDRDNYETISKNIKIAIATARVEIAPDVWISEVSGIPSGWAWTALLDTVVNFAQFWSVHLWTAELGLNTWGVVEPQMFGDDIAAIVAEQQEAIWLVATYQGLKYKATPTKISVNREFVEFLRLVIRQMASKGYLTRLITSMCIEQPGGSMTVDISGKAREWVSKCDQAVSRGADKTAVSKMLLHELKKMTKWEAAEEWLTTDANYGGGGWEPVGEQVKRWEFSVDKWMTVKPTESDNLLRSFVSLQTANWPGEVNTAEVYRQMWEQVVKVKPTYRKHTFEEVKVIDSVMTLYMQGGTPKDVNNTELRAALTQEMNSIRPKRNLQYSANLDTQLLNHCIKTDNMEWYEQKVLTTESQAVLEVLKVKATKSVWIAWLKGDWDVKASWGSGVQPTIVTRIAQMYANRMLLRAISQSQGELTKPLLLAILVASQRRALTVVRGIDYNFGY